MDDKEKQVEEMAKARCKAYGGHTDYELCGHCYGEKDKYIGCQNGMAILVDAGYGDKKQAVKEFIKRVNDELENLVMEKSSQFNDGYNDCLFDTRCLLDALFKELYENTK